MADDFSENLSFLCSHHPSIAEVCRRIGINRQQFNKYLNGQSRPARANMRRICDFFGVTEAEILAEPSQLRSMISVRSKPPAVTALDRPFRDLETLYRRSQSLSRYVGYYYRYFYSFSHYGRIFRSFGALYERDGRFFWKNIELVRNPHAKNGRAMVKKYEGTVFLLTNRIYVIEFEALQHYSLTQMILFPSYENRVSRLIGIQTGGPTKRGRRPGASKVMLEYLGRSVDVKKALYACGLYDADDETLPKGISELIFNRIEDGSFVLEVSEL